MIDVYNKQINFCVSFSLIRFSVAVLYYCVGVERFVLLNCILSLDNLFKLACVTDEQLLLLTLYGSALLRVWC